MPQRNHTPRGCHPDSCARGGLALAVAAVGDEATTQRLLDSAVSDARVTVDAEDAYALVDGGELLGPPV